MELFTTENLLALVTLTSLEVILGIDNIVVLTIIVSRLPVEKQDMVRRVGLLCAMGARIGLLFCISLIMSLTQPLFSIGELVFTGKSLVLILGGLFLIGKATIEIQHSVEFSDDPAEINIKARKSVMSAIIQILLIDIIFSIDSVITAVGMASHLPVMVLAIVLSVIMMMLGAKPIATFIEKHPTFKVLALSFLVLIGAVLVLDGFGTHVDKAYIYFAMGFSAAVSAINLQIAHKPKKKG